MKRNSVTIIETEFIELPHELDVQAFWAENDQCLAITPNKPRCAASFSTGEHWLMQLMQEFCRYEG